MRPRATPTKYPRPGCRKTVSGSGRWYDVLLRLVPHRVDFRLARNAAARCQPVNHTRQHARKLGEQFLFAHAGLTGEVGDRGLAERIVQLIRLDRRIPPGADPGIDRLPKA